MKKTILLFLMVQTICVTHVCANVSITVLFSGTQGANEQLFRLFCRADWLRAASTDNSFFGYQSGLMTQGTQNTGFGAKTLYSNSSGSR